MYLMDTINQAAERIRAASLVPTTQMMAAYADLGTRLQGTPRFLLDRRACQTSVELSLGRPKVLREAMSFVRVPYRRMWVEWDDVDRSEIRDRLGEVIELPELRPLPGRVGFLLEADETGRRGTATWAWTTGSGGLTTGFPNVAPIEQHYDLDQTFPIEPTIREGLLGAKIFEVWKDNPVQMAAMLDIWHTCEHKLADWGPSYLAQFGNPEMALMLSRADVVGEYITIWSVLMMLTASRPFIRLDTVDMGKLNKHRAKKREAPLLDYTRVSLDLSLHVARPVRRDSLGYQRKPPRIHIVSSFLNRRGDKHWIVAPFMRGSGEVIHRRVHVRG